MSSNRQSVIVQGFRASAVGQMLAVFAQAMLAGFALSGSSGALHAHMVNGAVALAFSILQMVFGLFLGSKVPGWVHVAGVALVFGEAAQMASGRHFMLAVHFPLGLALFATVVAVVVWIAIEGPLIHGVSAMPEDRARRFSYGGE